VNLDALLYLALLSALATCFAAIGARALRVFSRHDLQELCERRKQPDLYSQIMRNDDRVALGMEMVVVVGTTLFVVAGSVWGGMRYEGALPSSWPLLAASVLTLSLVVAATTVWIPWSITRISAARFLTHTWPLWLGLSRLVSPLTWGAQAVDLVFHRMVGRTPQQPDEESIEEEIRTIVSDGQREGLLEEDAREMIEGVMELGEVDVSHIMTPRTEMHMLPVNIPWDEMLADVIGAGHTRIPVYDNNRDDIIGLLYSKDLLPELAKSGDEPRRPFREILRKPLFVPETKAVDDLLEMLQQSRTHIAVVLDEYGGVAGLVTIEDVLEEIVGDIVDEYDQEVEEEIFSMDANTCEALGRAHVDEINQQLGIELPEDDDFDTIGGFVFTEFGRIPLAGESFTWQGLLQITVLEATHRRIVRVRLERLGSKSQEIA